MDILKIKIQIKKLRAEWMKAIRTAPSIIAKEKI